MRYIAMFMATAESENAPPPTAEQFAEMQAYNEDLAKRGILLAAEGLGPTAKSARVIFDNDERTVIDGPFTESKEFVGGFTILNVSSREEAIEVVKRAPTMVRDRLAVVEIRKLMDIEDFGENFTPNEEIAKVKYRAPG